MFLPTCPEGNWEMAASILLGVPEEMGRWPHTFLASFPKEEVAISPHTLRKKKKNGGGHLTISSKKSKKNGGGHAPIP